MLLRCFTNAGQIDQRHSAFTELQGKTMSTAGAAVQGMRGADTGLKNGITQAAFAGAGFTHNANHGLVMNNTVEMFKDFLAYFLGRNVRYDFTCAEREELLNGIPVSC